MIDQCTLNLSPHVEKRVTETSKESYREVSVNLKGRQLTVLHSLHRYHGTTPNEPTSSMLMKYMGVYDPNMVRPRLTELAKAGMVETGEPIHCPVTGKKAHTWHVTTRGVLFLRGQK